MTDLEIDGTWSGRPPAEVEDFLHDTADMVRQLDDTPLHEMTPLFHQHAYQQ